MNVASLLDVAGLMMPDVRIATDQGGSWTYSEFGHFATAVAGDLCDRGEPSSRVATVQVPSNEHLAFLFGAWSAGWTVSPLNFRLRPKELADQLDVVGPDLIVADERYHALLRDVVGSEVDVVEAGSLAADSSPSDQNHTESLPGEHVAVLLFTSGTTGTAKPVYLSHGPLFQNVTQTVEPPSGGSRGSTLLAVPTYHVAGLSTVLASVYMGREIVTLPSFSAPEWLSAVEMHRVEHAFVVPTMLKRLLDDPAFGTTDLTSLRLLSYGAAPADERLVRRAIEAFPDKCGFVNAYGQTETGGTVTLLSPDDHRVALHSNDDRVRDRLGSIGKPLPGVSIDIVDKSGSGVVPVGDSGELAVRRGGGDWIRTGDMARMDEDGYVFLTGRSTDRIIRGGENIDPAEIERVITEVPGVDEVAVVGEPDSEWGEIVVAHVVAMPGEEVSAVDIKDHVRGRVASYKVPAKVVFEESLPRNSLGKVVKRQLKAGVHQ